MKKYKMPKGYLQWDKFIQKAQLIPSDKINYQMDKENYCGKLRDSHQAFLQSQSPVYCIKEELLDAFLRTDIYGDVPLFVNLQISLPMFVVFFPDNKLFNPIANGASIKYLIITHTDTDLSKEYLQYFGWSGLDDKDQLLLCGRYIRKDGTYRPSAYVGEATSIQKERNIQIFSVVAQILLCLQYYPEILQGEFKPEKFGAGSGFKKFTHEPEYLHPRWLGNPRVSRGKSTNNKTTGSAKTSHLRRGHWRMQACGESHTERKLIWIFPTFVLGGKI